MLIWFSWVWCGLGYEEVGLWSVLAGDVVGFVAELEDGGVDDARAVSTDCLEFDD